MTPLSIPSESESLVWRVIKAATHLSGQVNGASSYFQNEALPAFAFKTAEQLVSEGRAEDVL